MAAMEKRGDGTFQLLENAEAAIKAVNSKYVSFTTFHNVEAMSYWWCLKHRLDWMDIDFDLYDLMENVETAILDEKDNNIQSRCIKKFKSLKPIVRQAYQDASKLIELLKSKENKWDDLTRNGSFGKNVQSVVSGFKYVPKEYR